MASIATKALDFDNKAVEFTFAGEETPTLVSLADFPEEIQLHLALHGLSQKLGDSYASAKGEVVKAKELFSAVIAQLTSGEWRAARGEGEAKPRSTELVEALARIKNLAVADVAKALAAYDKDKLKTLRSNGRVKAVIAVIRAEKAQAKLAKLDTDAGDTDFAL